MWPLSAPVFFFRLTRSIGKISSDRNYDITFRPTSFSSLSFVPLLRLSFGFFFICAQYRWSTTIVLGEAYRWSPRREKLQRRIFWCSVPSVQIAASIPAIPVTLIQRQFSCTYLMVCTYIYRRTWKFRGFSASSLKLLVPLYFSVLWCFKEMIFHVEFLALRLCLEENVIRFIIKK